MNFSITPSQLLAFISSEVNNFIQDHPDEAFYAFALDTNAAYGEVNLCFNTEPMFAKTLSDYQNGRYGEEYQQPQDIWQLRYNTGDWDYQCFATLYLIDDGALEDGDECEQFMHYVCRSLIDYLQTDGFKAIPKTVNFKVLCIDHDEDIVDAQQRLQALDKNAFFCLDAN